MRSIAHYAVFTGVQHQERDIGLNTGSLSMASRINCRHLIRYLARQEMARLWAERWWCSALGYQFAGTILFALFQTTVGLITVGWQALLKEVTGMCCSPIIHTHFLDDHVRVVVADTKGLHK